jgi:hypothetical protein
MAEKKHPLGCRVTAAVRDQLEDYAGTAGTGASRVLADWAGHAADVRGARWDGEPWTWMLRWSQTVLRRSLAEIRGQLSRAEASLIADTLNGTLISPDVGKARLVAEVSDGCTLNGLGAKWTADGPALVEKLQAMTEAQAGALVVWAGLFWDRSTRELQSEEHDARLFAMLGAA